MSNLHFLQLYYDLVLSFTGGDKFSLATLLQFITGSRSVPPLGFPHPITVKFKHGCPDGCKCRPVSSTCDLSITLPVHYQQLEFNLVMSSAMVECAGFGKV